MRSHRRGQAWLSGLMAVLVALPSQLTDPAMGSVHFRFAPRDGQTFVERETRNQVQSIGTWQRRVIHQTVVSQVTVRKVPAGWTFTFVLQSFLMKTDGLDTAPAMDRLKGLEVVLHVDAAGKLRQVVGLKEYLARVLGELPGFLVQAMVALVDESKLRQEIEEEWNDRVAFFVGARGRVGQAWVAQGELPSMAGKVPYFSTTALTERVSLGKTQCVKIAFVNSTDREKLRPLAGALVDRLPASPTPASTSPVEFMTVGERIVDPRTLMLHRERMEKTSTSSLSVPFLGSVPVHEEETRETLWEFAE